MTDPTSEPTPYAPKKDPPADWIGGIVGTASIVWGVGSAVSPSETLNPPGPWIAGAGVAIAGVLVLPPVTKFLRMKMRALRPLGAPPLVWFACIMFGIGIGSTFDKRLPPTVTAKAGTAPSSSTPDPAKPATPPSTPAQDQTTDFIALVDSSYLPQVAHLSISEPDTLDALWKRENEIEVLATFLDSDRISDPDSRDPRGGTKPDTPPLAAARKKFRAALSAKQAKVYPVLRRAYIKLIANKVWADNVIVRGKDRHIIYTSAMFASNGNIQTAYDGLAFDLRKLRFKRVSFPWYQGGSGYYYDLDVPSDTTVVIWPGVGATTPYDVVK